MTASTFSFSGAIRSRAPRIGLALLAAVATAGLALAQETKEEIIVTGSRVSRSGFDSAQPLTSIDSTQIQNLGIVNTGDVLRTLPQNTPFFTETNVGIGNFNVGAQLANLRGLNPFFGTRTLDPRRHQARGAALGGRSRRPHADPLDARRAHRGRDGRRVGGVRLRRNRGRRQRDPRQEARGLQGASRLRPDHGKATGATRTARSRGAPASERDNRGHVLAGIEYQKQDTIGPCSQDTGLVQRRLAHRQQHRVRDGRNGLPNFYLAPGGKQTPSENGTIHAVHQHGLHDDRSSACVQHRRHGADRRSIRAPPASGFAARVGGDGSMLAYDTSNIRPEVERYAAMGRVSLDLSNKLHWFAELAYANSKSDEQPGERRTRTKPAAHSG